MYWVVSVDQLNNSSRPQGIQFLTAYSLLEKHLAWRIYLLTSSIEETKMELNLSQKVKIYHL